jgi:hypothetical protein
LRATFDVAIDLGPVTFDERTANDASVAGRHALARGRHDGERRRRRRRDDCAQMNADPLNKLEIGIKRATM